MDTDSGTQSLSASEHCLPHWWFVSRSTTLEEIVDASVTEVGEEAEPALMMTADALQRVTGHSMPPGASPDGELCFFGVVRRGVLGRGAVVVALGG